MGAVCGVLDVVVCVAGIALALARNTEAVARAVVRTRADETVIARPALAADTNALDALAILRGQWGTAVVGLARVLGAVVGMVANIARALARDTHAVAGAVVGACVDPAVVPLPARVADTHSAVASPAALLTPAVVGARVR